MKTNVIQLLCGFALLILGACLFEGILFTKQASQLKKMNQQTQTLMLPAGTNSTGKQKTTTTIYRQDNH